MDEGYAAITQDNGKQRILAGGATHMLTHRNWKFEKLISLKIHTDDLGPFRATTADNVVLETSATVNWRVENPELAARMAADTMAGSDRADGGFVGGNASLRRDVLKQAVASLAAAMGSVRYSDDVHVAASDKVTLVDSCAPQPRLAPQEEVHGVAQIFSVQQMSAAAKHANEICSQYGVSIVSINVITAVPQDQKLDEVLAAGALAHREDGRDPRREDDLLLRRQPRAGAVFASEPKNAPSRAQLDDPMAT